MREPNLLLFECRISLSNEIFMDMNATNKYSKRP